MKMGRLKIAIALIKYMRKRMHISHIADHNPPRIF